MITISGLDCGAIYTITAQGIYNNETMVGPEYFYGNVTTGSCLLVISEGKLMHVEILVRYMYNYIEL